MCDIYCIFCKFTDWDVCLIKRFPNNLPKKRFICTNTYITAAVRKIWNTGKDIGKSQCQICNERALLLELNDDNYRSE